MQIHCTGMNAKVLSTKDAFYSQFLCSGRTVKVQLWKHSHDIIFVFCYHPSMKLLFLLIAGGSVNPVNKRRGEVLHHNFPLGTATKFCRCFPQRNFQKPKRNPFNVSSACAGQLPFSPGLQAGSLKGPASSNSFHLALCTASSKGCIRQVLVCVANTAFLPSSRDGGHILQGLEAMDSKQQRFPFGIVHSFQQSLQPLQGGRGCVL